MRNLEIKNNDCHAALAMTKSVQSGRSMIEMLGVLAIIGVLSVGGIAGYSKAMMKYRINKTIEQITLIAGNIRAFWGPQKNYIGVRCTSFSDGTGNALGCHGQSYGDGCPIVKKAKIFPDEMITVTDGKIMSITNPFGGGVGLGTQDKAKYGDSQAFYIDYTIGDNEEACIELLSQDWTSAGVVAVYTDVAKSGEIIAKVPLSVDNAVKFCADMFESEAEGRYIEFMFDVDYSWWSDGLTTYDD
ncbi:MAG: hypothetical protein IJ525_04385 [Alphaproteobacteria bacterium]|nr:hypothetical protein [Alphaproteobacteria bacterium]